MEADPLDDSWHANDFESVKDDLSRSHYVLVDPARPAWGLGELVGRRPPEEAKVEARGLGELRRAWLQLGLPRVVLENAAYLYRLSARALPPAQGRRRLARRLAILVEAARMSGLPAPPSLWRRAAAALLGYDPSSPSSWAAEGGAALATAAVFELWRLRRALGLPQRRAELFSALGPRAAAEARRLLAEVDAALGRSLPEAARRALAAALAHAELGELRRPEEVAAEVGAGVGALREGLRALASEAVLAVALGPGGARPPLLPPGGRPRPAGRARARCSVCGFEWEAELSAPAAGSLLDRLYWALASLAGGRCPRCGAPLSGIVRLGVLPLEAPHDHPAPEDGGNGNHGGGDGA